MITDKVADIIMPPIERFHGVQLCKPVLQWAPTAAVFSTAVLVLDHALDIAWEVEKKVRGL